MPRPAHAGSTIPTGSGRSAPRGVAFARLGDAASPFATPRARAESPFDSFAGSSRQGDTNPDRRHWPWHQASCQPISLLNRRGPIEQGVGDAGLQPLSVVHMRLVREIQERACRAPAYPSIAVASHIRTDGQLRPTRAVPSVAPACSSISLRTEAEFSSISLVLPGRSTPAPTTGHPPSDLQGARPSQSRPGSRMAGVGSLTSDGVRRSVPG